MSQGTTKPAHTQNPRNSTLSVLVMDTNQAYNQIARHTKIVIPDDTNEYDFKRVHRTHAGVGGGEHLSDLAVWPPVSTMHA